MNTSSCYACGEALSHGTQFCDGCGAMASQRTSNYPTQLFATPAPAYAASGGYSGATADGCFPEVVAPAPSEPKDWGTIDRGYVDQVLEEKAFPWLAAISIGMLLLLSVSVWWWQRGSNVHFKITPADANVTLDGEPLAVVNGEVTIDGLKRGPHMLIINPLQGGSLHHSVDISFLEASQDVVVKVPGSDRTIAAPAHKSRR